MKAGVATGILIAIFTGMVANGLAAWKEISVVSTRVDNVEKTQDSYDNKMQVLQRKIDDIHWHLIGSKEKTWRQK